MKRASLARKVLATQMNDGTKLMFFVKEHLGAGSVEDLRELMGLDESDATWYADEYARAMGHELFAKSGGSALHRMALRRKTTTMELIAFYRACHYRVFDGTFPKLRTADFRVLRALALEHSPQKVRKAIESMFNTVRVKRKVSVALLRQRMEKDA